MFNRFRLSTLVTGAALTLLSAVAHAAQPVTFNTAGNGVDDTGVVFAATGAAGVINSTFTIGATTGVTYFTEVGSFQITSFGTTPSATNPLGTVDSGVLTDFNIFADIDFSGMGIWMPNGFGTASFVAIGGDFDLQLRAVNLSTNATIDLGSAALVLGNDTVAVLTLVNNSGAALTSLSGTFAFTPAAGTTGSGNFFEAPTPFNIGFAVGNFGGNAGNISYSVDSNGVMTVLTPGPNQPAATGNLTFVNVVPEASQWAMLALGLPLLLTVAARRKA